MILVETGEQSESAFMQAVVFAEQLRAAGLNAVIDGEAIPEETRFPPRFQALPFLRRLPETPITQIAFLGAENSEPAALNRFQRLNLGPDVTLTGFGTFETQQEEIAATARLRYATGLAPHMISLNDVPAVQAGKAICPCYGAEVDRPHTPHLRGRPSITVVVSEVEDPAALNGLQYLTTSRSMNALIYMSGRQKSEWLRTYPPGAHVYGFSEIGPVALTSQSSVLVLTGPIGNNYSALCLLNNHLLSGSAIIDATPDASFVEAGFPVHRGPVELAYLSMFLTETILPNLGGIAETAKTNGTVMGHSINRLFSKKDAAAAPIEPAPAPRSIYFMPTNGNGLGHAQRCALIAEQLPAWAPQTRFFAYPSCLPMINKAGFEAIPLVPRSAVHAAPEANDMANAARLEAQFQTGDVFAFDGGYVFDSVVRSIVDFQLNSVWIRRGLWRASQDNRIPMDREKYFAKVIVPQECLDSLNQGLSSGAHIETVGPIVRQVAPSKENRETLLEGLRAKLGVPFEKLVVTMLGSGASHDLSANIQTICAAIEQRQDCLNLIVTWPSAIVPAERYSWTRSRVIKTMQATWLAAHADVVISAAGYNSFHEALYNGVPTIFVPQEAQILDDQEMRAEAAAKLGLAAHAPAGKLSRLDRELRGFLNGARAEEIKSALAEFTFPQPGTARAAGIIAEMAS